MITEEMLWCERGRNYTAVNFCIALKRQKPHRIGTVHFKKTH